MVKLGDVFQIGSGGTPSKSHPEYYGGDIPWVKTGDLGKQYIYSVDECITEEGLRNSSAKMYGPDTVLVAMYGATIGATSILKINACTNQACAAFRPAKGIMPEYLYYFLNSKKNKFIHDGVGGAQPNISATYLKSVPFPMLPLESQKNIVNRLNRTRAIITIRQQQLKALDTLIKARFVEMFGNIKETVPLSYYIESLTAGKSLAGEEECHYKVLKTGAVTYDYFDSSQVKNLPMDYEPLPEHQIHDGEVIISRMNTAELVGAAAYVWKAPERTYLPDRLWRAELNENANPIFIWQAIVQPATKEAIRRIAGGTSGSMKNISKTGLLSLLVRKVTLEQQNEFATFVSQVNKSKSSVQQSLAESQLLFDSLMQKYFG